MWVQQFEVYAARECCVKHFILKQINTRTRKEHREEYSLSISVFRSENDPTQTLRMDTDDQNKPRPDQEKADSPASGGQESVVPEETSDSPATAPQQSISEGKGEQEKEHPPPIPRPTTPAKRTEILVIPTVPAPKVVCVPFNASDESSPPSTSTKDEDQKPPAPSPQPPPLEPVDKKATIIVPKQVKQRKPSKEEATKKAVSQSGVVKFSDPQGNGEIKIDMSQSITPPGSSQVSDMAVKEEPARDETVEDIPLQCDEKIEDSPEPENKSSSRATPKDVETETIEDLLKPLDAQNLLPIKPSPSFGLNEFGLYEISKPRPREELRKDHVTPSPRKDTSAAKRIQDDNILMCEGCGCYGMAGEFVAQNSCSPTCTRLIMEKLREKQKKEREALKQKQKRDAKLGKKSSLPESREMSVPKTTHYNESYPWQDTNGFNWQKYLEWSSSKAAPVTFFKANPFPKPHQFAKGMKLEAVDPQTPSMICVVSVVEILGARLRLHFDGYSDTYDVWENVNSENLFPVGWCEKNNQCLVPPKGRKYLYVQNMNDFLFRVHSFQLLLELLPLHHQERAGHRAAVQSVLSHQDRVLHPGLAGWEQTGGRRP